MGQELRQLTINSELNWNPDVKFLMGVNLILLSMLIADLSLIFLSRFELANQECNLFHNFFKIYFFTCAVCWRRLVKQTLDKDKLS